MKIFAYERLCSRCHGEEIPRSAYGFRDDMMLQSLLFDISKIHHIDLTIVRDISAPVLRVPSSVRVLACATDDAASAVDQCMLEADAIWPVVPESAGILESVSQRILHRNKLLIGSSPASVRTAASKYATSRVLEQAGVPVVQTYQLGDILPDRVHAWVVKPDDGAGCTNTHLFADHLAAVAWMTERLPEKHVLQPYIHGRHCSLSLVCADEQVLMLSRNEQRIVVSDNQLHHMGSTVNGYEDVDGQFLQLAQRVVVAIPGLWGYVGIDFIMTPTGPVVLEVNPRMTTSHTGLHDSFGYNPTRMIIELVQAGHCQKWEPRRTKPINVDVGAFRDTRSYVTTGPDAR